MSTHCAALCFACLLTRIGCPDAPDQLVGRTGSPGDEICGPREGLTDRTPRWRDPACLASWHDQSARASDHRPDRITQEVAPRIGIFTATGQRRHRAARTEDDIGLIRYLR